MEEFEKDVKIGKILDIIKGDSKKEALYIISEIEDWIIGDNM